MPRDASDGFISFFCCRNERENIVPWDPLQIIDNIPGPCIYLLLVRQVYTCILIHTYIYVCNYIYKNIGHIYIHRYIYIYIGHIYMYIHTYIGIYMYIVDV